MAKNEKQFFHKSVVTGKTLLNSVAAAVVTGQVDDSDVTGLYAICTGGVARVLTLTTTDDDIIAIVNIPASSGQLVGTPAVRVLASNLIPGSKLDPFGNYFLTLPNTKSIKARIDAGNDVVLIWERRDY